MFWTAIGFQQRLHTKTDAPSAGCASRDIGVANHLRRRLRLSANHAQRLVRPIGTHWKNIGEPE